MYKPDPTIGAVLCGFDTYISRSPPLPMLDRDAWEQKS